MDGVTLIVKPTVDCNLRCQYCYEGDSPYVGTRMSKETLRHGILKFVDHNADVGETQFIWHGGEVLLMGQKFFEDICRVQDERPNHRFHNCLQTNGTLLTETMSNFFDKHNFSVGISIDGPAALHDLHRPYANGNPSFSDSTRGLPLCRKPGPNGRRGYRLDSALAVMTRETLNDLNSFYEYFSNRTLNVRINPVFYEGRGRTAKKTLGISSVECSAALIWLFDRWMKDSSRSMRIEPFFEMIGNLVLGRANGCVFQSDCFRRFLEIAPNGDVYPCTGSASATFLLGNVNSGIVDDMLHNGVLDTFEKARSVSIRQCRDCSYLNICNAGCIRKSYMRRKRLSDRDYYCGAYKAVYRHIDNWLQGELGADYRTAGIASALDTRNDLLCEVIKDRSAGAAGANNCADLTDWGQWSGNWASDWGNTYTSCY
ncbi:MAG: radical SAM protein [Candidatus Latescibacteria bacterium]|nr:radical SAM protein [Candidatus Latescibacterota bacterium]